MEKFYNYIGITMMIPLAILEFAIKFVWSILFFAFKPLWRALLSYTGFQNAYNYATNFRFLEVCSRIWKLWE